TRRSAGLEDDRRFGLIGDEGGVPTIAVLRGDPLYSGYELTGRKIPVDDTRLLTPVIPRSKVVCVGRNYTDHAQEMGGDVPAEPLVFIKPNTSVIGPDEPIFYPRQSTNVQFEGELAVVVGRICKELTAEDVPKVILGYTIANDVPPAICSAAITSGPGPKASTHSARWARGSRPIWTSVILPFPR